MTFGLVMIKIFSYSKWMYVRRGFLFFNPFLKNILENNAIKKIFRELTQLGKLLVSLETQKSLMTMVIRE